MEENIQASVRGVKKGCLLQWLRESEGFSAKSKGRRKRREHLAGVQSLARATAEELPASNNDLEVSMIRTTSQSVVMGNNVCVKRRLRRARALRWLLPLISVLLLAPATFAENKVMGEVQFDGKSDVEKTSGVWVDGEYVGYLKELKGSKKVMLLPGEHLITVRQDGYEDFVQHILVQPGETRLIYVVMEKAQTGPLSDVTATVKIAVNPSRAAVFLDGLFVGHVGEFEGLGRGLLVSPGQHRIEIALPGYKTFDADINPTANQHVEVKTDLTRSDAPLSAPLVKDSSSTEPQSETPPAQPPEDAPHH